MYVWMDRQRDGSLDGHMFFVALSTTFQPFLLLLQAAAPPAVDPPVLLTAACQQARRTATLVAMPVARRFRRSDVSAAAA